MTGSLVGVIKSCTLYGTKKELEKCRFEHLLRKRDSSCISDVSELACKHFQDRNLFAKSGDRPEGLFGEHLQNMKSQPFSISSSGCLNMNYLFVPTCSLTDSSAVKYSSIPVSETNPISMYEYW